MSSNVMLCALYPEEPQDAGQLAERQQMHTKGYPDGPHGVSLPGPKGNTLMVPRGHFMGPRGYPEDP